LENYTKRSQPFLFMQMVWDYLNVTNNPETSREFIAEVIWQLDDEFKFWMNCMVNVSMDGKMYKLARYSVEVDGPRPESYEEDHSLARKLAEGERKEWYTHEVRSRVRMGLFIKIVCQESESEC
jgi:neutral trehalase